MDFLTLLSVLGVNLEERPKTVILSDVITSSFPSIPKEDKINPILTQLMESVCSVGSTVRCPPSLPPCVFYEQEFDLCLILSFPCVLSIGLRVIVCVVGISEDRKRSASAPTLGTVPLHASSPAPRSQPR